MPTVRRRYLARTRPGRGWGKIWGQFLGRDHFQLREDADARAPIVPPSMEVCHVAKTPRLHVIAGDLDNQFWADGFPG
jgi:hypothetical protein